MRLLDRLSDRYRAAGYWEGMASGAAILSVSNSDPRGESAFQPVIAAAEQAYTSNGIVFACTLVRMMMLSEAAFKFRVLSDKRLVGNRSLSILEHPWPGATAGELWARMEQQESLYGNAFVAKVADDELLILPANEVVIVSAETVSANGTRYKRPIGYDWDPERKPGTGKSAKAQFFTTDEVAHWSPVPDPCAKWRGMSWLTPVLNDVSSDNAFTAYKTQYLYNGSQITAVKYARPLSAEMIDDIIARLQARYAGVGNAGKTLVFDAGADPILDKGLSDVDVRAVQESGELRICAAAGVSPILIGLREANAGETYQSAMRQFADMHARPLWRSACAALEKLVEIPGGMQLWFDTTDIAALQAAETERAQVVQVSAAAMLTFVQAGFTRESIISAVTSGDLTLLQEDTQSIAADAQSKLGQAPGVQTVLTKPQTPASKLPMPASFPSLPSATGRPRAPSANGG